jgi:integrase
VTYLSSVLKRQEGRDDDWSAPSFAVLKQENPERQRTRTLSDDEIRKLWAALHDDTFGAFCRLLLLTAQRRNDIGNMLWSEIDQTTLTIPPERYKTGGGQVVPLTDAALAILDALPKRREDRVFPVFSYSLQKHRLDAKVPLGERWTLHDLRRTGKTLMARAGVRPDISERVLGHTIRGVEGVYDRHDYLAEKRDALERLGALIDRIIDPPADNVVELRA